MIEKFNNIWYLLIFLIHFIGIGIYAYQTIFQTRKFCTKFEIDDSGFPMVEICWSFHVRTSFNGILYIIH